MKKITPKQVERSRKQTLRFTDFLDTKSFEKSDYNDYVSDSEQNISIQPLNPEQRNQLYKQNTFNAYPKFHLIKQQDSSSLYSKPIATQYINYHKQQSSSQNSQHSQQNSKDLQPIVIQVPSFFQYSRPNEIEFTKHCLKIEKNPYVFIPIKQASQSQGYSYNENQKTRTRIPPLKYWCQQKIIKHGRITGIMTKNYQ